MLHLEYKILLCEPKIEFTKLREEKPYQPTIVCSPSGLKDSKRYKPKMMQSQRDEESQMLVKHYIMILLHSESNYYNRFKSVEYLTPNWVTG